MCKIDSSIADLRKKYVHWFVTNKPQKEISDKCWEYMKSVRHTIVNKFIGSERATWIPHHVFRWRFYGVFLHEVLNRAPSEKIRLTN